MSAGGADYGFLGKAGYELAIDWMDLHFSCGNGVRESASGMLRTRRCATAFLLPGAGDRAVSCSCQRWPHFRGWCDLPPLQLFRQLDKAK